MKSFSKRVHNGSLGLLVAACMLAAGSRVLAEAERESDDAEESAVDHLGLAARMLHDGHTERALKVLEEIQPDAPGIDGSRFFTLRGVARLQLKDYSSARRDFEAAIAGGQQDSTVRLQLAQACYALKEYACVLKALKQAGSAAENEPAALLMRTESLWHTGQKHAALAVLEKGERRFPKNAEFQRLQLFYLIDLGLYVEAVSVSERYLARSDIAAPEYVAVGEALRAARQPARAQVVMEGARLRFPDDEAVLVQLAHAHLDAGNRIASAMLFEQASRLNPKFLLEAAELYKEAGFLHRALWLNARITDQKAKTKQRLGLLVDAQEFDNITAMLSKLERLELLSDENIRYAVAYALYKTGQFAQSEAHLKHIREPQLFESAMQLRKAMQACAEAGWECTP